MSDPFSRKWDPAKKSLSWVFSYSTYPPKWLIIFCKMLVFFGRYIILAKHHFAIFFFGFFVLECIIFYLSFSWLVFLFLSLSFCNSALFSFNSMYHFATQLWFLSKRFKRYLWANGRCYITSACPSPSTNRAHERGQYKAASFCFFYNYYTVPSSHDAYVCPDFDSSYPRMAGGAYGRPRGT